jgi:hypothetical protein
MNRKYDESPNAGNNEAARPGWSWTWVSSFLDEAGRPKGTPLFFVSGGALGCS